MRFLVLVLLVTGFSDSLCQNISEVDYLLPLVELGEIQQQWFHATTVPEFSHAIHGAAQMQSKSSPVSAPGKAYAPATKHRQCSEDLLHVLQNLNSKWARKMLDSDSKLTSGLLLGSVTWPGNFKECRSVYAPFDDNGRGDFFGRYCSVSWTVTLPGDLPQLPLSTALCVPDSCDADDISTGARNIGHFLSRLPLLKNLNKSTVELGPANCKHEVEAADGYVITLVTIMSAFLFLVVLGTITTAYVKKQTPPKQSRAERFDSFSTSFKSAISFDQTHAANYGSMGPAEEDSSSLSTSAKERLCQKPSTMAVAINDEPVNDEKTPRKIEKWKISLKDVMLCFCAFTNGSKIMDTDVPGSQLLSIHGIRFLSLTWVIMGHSYISSVKMIRNPLEVLKELDSFPFQMVLQAPFSVDSFFLLSGFLVAYLFFKEADKKDGKISWLYFYLHRLWRLTPVYMIAVAFFILAFKYLGSGPFWDENHGDDCRHTWWWYLLYINNFIPVKDMCVGWSWYLANDMQFYFLSPLFLYPLWRWPKIGCSLVVFSMVGSWAITGVISSQYDLIPMFVGVANVKDLKAYQDRMWYSFDMIYDKPYCRISPYLIGILLGYSLFKIGNRRNFLPWYHQALGWALAAVCACSVVFGLFHAEVAKLTGTFYDALSRSAFSLGLAWLIFACETGHGGAVHKLLSLKFWIPLSRLTYCAYLVHPILIHGYYQALQTTLYFTQLVMVTNFLGFLLISYALAFLVSITFESPMLNVEKLLLKRQT